MIDNLQDKIIQEINKQEKEEYKYFEDNQQVKYNKQLANDGKKAIKSLVNSEIQELKNWCYRQFSKQHPHILQKCFAESWGLKY